MTIWVAVLSCALMIALVVAKPAVTVGERSVNIYWVPPLLGALVLLISGAVPLSAVLAAFFSSSDISPLKILVLFLSMTLISVFLDTTGFFSWLATLALRRAGRSQLRLFVTLYLMVSVLTVFTSNDIIVLTFTPFIGYFAKRARIDPIPFLVGEFVGANTWSMALQIGNPTNIYLSGTAGVRFLDYLAIMALPTLLAGAVSLGAMLLLFHRSLKAPIDPQEGGITEPDRPLMRLGLAHLGVCIALMVVSSYIGLPMWIVSFVCFVSLYCLAVLWLKRAHRELLPVKLSLRRTPVDIIPFILSMFVVVLSLEQSGWTGKLAGLLEGEGLLWRYGAASFLACNVVNNIPMSVLFSSVIGFVRETGRTQALYATVIGSNLGAFLTPIGALAGIMWMGMLRNQGVRFGFGRFVRCCGPASVAAMAAALLGLAIVL